MQRMKLSWTLLLLTLFLIPLVACTQVPVNEATVIHISDPYLEQLVREHLQIDGEITNKHLLQLEHLESWDHLPVKSLNGLQYAKNLECIILPFAQIDDLTPLENLPHLQAIHLKGNLIDDIESLTLMPNLNWIILDHNQLANLSSLRELQDHPNLQYLFLRENPLTMNKKELKQVQADLAVAGIYLYLN